MLGPTLGKGMSKISTLFASMAFCTMSSSRVGFFSNYNDIADFRQCFTNIDIRPRGKHPFLHPYSKLILDVVMIAEEIRHGDVSRHFTHLC